MAMRHQVTKISNPRRTVRKMTPKQIRHFGTKRQKAALKAARKRTTVSHAHARRSVPNPAPLVVTLGSNPHRRRNTTVPATKKRRTRAANARRRVGVNRRHRRVAAKNPHHRRRTRAIAAAPRRRRRAVAANPRRHHRRTMRAPNPRRRRTSNPRRVYYINRRKNPSLFGSSLTSREGMKMIGGGFVGLIGAKFLPTLIPTSMAGSFMSSNIGRVVVTGVAGYATALVAGKIGGERFGDAALFGAIIQTASVALNAFLPSLYAQLGIGLGRVGDLVPGANFSVPQNPLLANQKMRAMLPAGAPMSTMAPTGSVMVNSGMGRAYPAAY